ncbi:hypothetical protein EI94DRAFT_1733895 [Lactarius quietus]|nr:hypothetical protein EI94DRAFT_1733895 [Lactarius quietus]
MLMEKCTMARWRTKRERDEVGTMGSCTKRSPHLGVNFSSQTRAPKSRNAVLPGIIFNHQLSIAEAESCLGLIQCSPVTRYSEALKIVYLNPAEHKELKFGDITRSKRMVSIMGIPPRGFLHGLNLRRTAYRIPHCPESALSSLAHRTEF